MQYYDIQKNWRIVKQYINEKDVQDVLVHDFNKFTFGLWKMEFKHGQLPFEFETCDWHTHWIGRRPEYWKYVKHSACHWLVNFNLMLAKKVTPDKAWRILTSKKHSTVWDGEKTIFDFNYMALGVHPKDAYTAAYDIELPIGKKMRIHLARRSKNEFND